MTPEHERWSDSMTTDDRAALYRLMLIALAASLVLAPLSQSLRADNARPARAERLAVIVSVVASTLSAGLPEMNAAQIGMLLLGILFVVGLPMLFVYAILGLIRSSRARDGSSGGVSGFLLEFDRFVRPSIQHVEQVKEEAPEDEHIDGE